MEKRRKEIYRVIQHNNKASIEELSSLLHVSGMTIRRDLNDLAEKGLITMIKGGAIIKHPLEFTFEEREKINRNKKIAIAKQAVKFISSGDTIMLDGSSTTYFLSNFLPPDITVVTNNLPIAINLMNHNKIEVIVLGGNLRKLSGTIVGTDAIKMLDNYQVDKSFISSNFIDFEYGVSDKTIPEAAIKKGMMKSSGENFFLMDSSKINYRTLYKVCDISDIDNLIVDSLNNLNNADEIIAQCMQTNTKLIIASS